MDAGLDTCMSLCMDWFSSPACIKAFLIIMIFCRITLTIIRWLDDPFYPSCLTSCLAYNAWKKRKFVGRFQQHQSFQKFYWQRYKFSNKYFSISALKHWTKWNLLKTFNKTLCIVLENYSWQTGLINTLIHSKLSNFSISNNLTNIFSFCLPALMEVMKFNYWPKQWSFILEIYCGSPRLFTREGDEKFQILTPAQSLVRAALQFIPFKLPTIYCAGVKYF